MNKDLFRELKAMAMEYDVAIVISRQVPSEPIFEMPTTMEDPIIFKIIKNRNQ